VYERFIIHLLLAKIYLFMGLYGNTEVIICTKDAILVSYYYKASSFLDETVVFPCFGILLLSSKRQHFYVVRLMARLLPCFGIPAVIPFKMRLFPFR
jgi:hypothetical protein